jgi:hypothetical protein
MACPVCGEPLEGRPDRCFRCETRLGAWWRLEDALGRLPDGAAPFAGADSAARPRRHGVGFGLLAGLAAGVAFVVLARPAAAPTTATTPASAPRPADQEPPAATPAPSPTTTPARPVRYRAQPGDSLWRIAAAFTGEGRRWTELFPGRASPHVAAGEWLDVAPVSPAPAAR